MASKVVDPKTYAKNVIKSAGYITAQSLKGVDQDLTNFIKESGSSAKEMYGFLKDFRGNVKRTVNNVLGETGFDDLRRIKSNALDDLRTGKFYNAERDNAENSAMMSKLGFSFDFDDLDFDVDEGFGEKKDEETAGVTESTAKSLADKIAEVQRGSSAASAAKIAKGARVNTAAMMAFEQKMFGQVTSSIAAVHGSILNLHKDLATPLNTHIINSANFYQAATTELAKQTSLLENINKMLTDRFAPPKHGFNRGKSAFEQVFGGGFPNLSTWGKIAKNRALQEVGVDMIGGMLNPEMMSILLSQASGSPIAQLAILGLTAGMKKSRFGKSVNRFSNTLKGGFMNTAARISNYARKNRNSDSLPAILARLFDIAPGLNKKIDFGNYNKGRAEWTGQDSRALQVVIPTQLAQILSALTGQEAKIYDYKAGKFVTARMAGNQFRKERTAAIGRATGGFKQEILQDFIDQDKAKHKNDNTPEYTMNSRAVRNLSRDYDTLMSLLSMHNVDVSQFKKKGDITRFCIRMGWVGNARTSGTKPFFFDSNSIMRIDAAIFRKPGTTGNLAGAMYAGRVGNNNFMADAANGNMAFFAGSDIGRSGKKMSIAHQFLDALDDKGNNVFFYLQDYYKQLRMIANNTRFGVGSGEGTGGASSRGSRGAGWQNPEVVNRSRNRSTRTRGAAPRYLTADDVDPEGRFRWNSSTESYDRPAPKAQSRYTREREKKDGIGAKIVNKITDVTNDLFFGGDSEGIRKWWKDNGGLVGTIKNLPNIISNAVRSAIDRAKEYVSGKWNQFKESQWGKDFFGAMKSSVKGFAKDTWDYAKDRSAKAYEWATGKKASWAGQVSPTAYRGGYVRKSGMVSVSEGERILPATGGASPSKRRWIERKNYRDWIKDGGDEEDYWGSFAKGGTAGPRAGYTTINDDDRNIARKMFFEGKSLNEIKDFFKSQNKHNSIAGFIRQSKEFKNKAKGFKDKAKDFIHQQGHNIDEALETLFGSPEKYNNIKGNIKEAYRAAKVNPPKMFAKGTLGALVGAATTGSGLGLLGGFVLGAGHEILQNSEYLSKKLFGEESVDEKTGKTVYKGGILPSKVSVFLKKTFPRMAKGGALGGVLGTLGVAPGGIFGGMVLGAGLELLSTTEAFKKAMFGPVGADGKTRRGGILGSIKLRVVDPLIEFTRNGLQKIGDFVKKNMFDPIKRFGKAASDWIKGKAKSIVANATDKLKEKVKATVGQKIDKLIVKPLAGAAGWVGKKALGAAKTVVSAPFKFVGNTLGGALERHNVKKGYSTLGIDERMKQFGADKNLEYTRKVAGLTGEARDKEIQRYYELLNGSNTAKRDMKKARQEMYETIASSFDNGGLDNPAEMKKIRSLLSSEAAINGNLSEVRKYITEESGLGEETQAQLIDILKSKQDRINELKANKDSYEARQQELFKELGITNERDKKRFIKKNRIQAAIDYEEMQKRKGVVNADLMNAAKSKDALKAKLKEQEQEQPIDAERNNILKQIASIARGIANHLGVTKDETPEADVSSTAEKLQEKVLPTAEGKPSLSNIGKSISSPTSVGDEVSGDGNVITKVLEDGCTVEYINVNGDLVPNMSDAKTKEHFSHEKQERSERSKFFGMFTGGGLLAGLKNLLAPKDGEKEGTFWDKLKSIFSSALPGIIAAVVAYFGIKGLGNFAQKNAGGALDPGMNKQKDAEERQQEVEGYGKVRKGILGINMIENKIRKRDMTTYDQDDYVSEYATQRYGSRVLKNAVLSLNKTTAKGVAFGSKVVSKIPIVGKVLAAPLNAVNIGKSIGTRVSKFGKAVGDAGKWVANTKAGKWIGSKVSGAAKSVFSAIGKTKVAQAADAATKPLREKITKAITTVIDFVKRKLGKTATNAAGEVAEAAVKEGAEDAAEQCVKAMGKNAAKNLSKVVIIFQLALIANAVTYGFQSAGAKCILGILDEPTLAQRCLAAAINGLNEAIPGIGGLIPSNVIFTIIYSLLKALGMKFTDLDEKRAKAKAEVEQYNKDNGTTYNVEEYVKNVLGELTFQDKVKKTVKGGLRKIGDFFKGKTVADDDAEAAKASKRNNMITDQDIRSNYQALNNKTASITTASGSKTVSGSSTAGTNTTLVDAKAMTGAGSGIIDFTGGASGARLNIKEAAHNIATKIGGVASTAAGYVSKFRSGIINLFTGETEGIPNTDSLIQALWNFTDPTTKLEDFDDTVKKFLTTGITPFGAALVTGISSIMKMAISLTRPLKTIAATMGTDIANAALVADAITSGGLTGESGTTAAIGGIRGTLNNFKNSVKSFGSKAWNWLKGNGFTEDTGSGSQPIHTTQKGNFDRFGHTTIDENGCGPAVAATVLKAYGKNVGIKTAADYASNNGYVAGSSGVGTRASYFGDILGRSGIRTAYTDNNKAIRKAVASGSPTILLGQDRSNRSKANSPFGPNPHYVVARGTDKRGNVYVDDPELGRTALYKSNILKSAKLGVATGGASGVEGVISEFTGNTFGLASERLGDSLAGRVLRTIFSSSSDNEGSDGEGGTSVNENGYSHSSGNFESSGGYNFTTGKYENGTILTSKQYINEVNPNVGSNTNRASTLFNAFTAGNLDFSKIGKYKYWYQTVKNGGLYKGDQGVPAHDTYDVVDSAVGWACARFNHIYTMLSDHKTGMAFPDFICDPKDFPKVAASYGISLNGTELSQSPQVGAIMVWGPSPSGGGNLKGHVAIVEKVESSHCVITSESGYATGHVYSIRREQSKCNGRWGMSSVVGGGSPGNDRVSNKLVFLGFIYNPAIVDALAVKTSREKTIENSPLTTDVIISPNKTPRTHPIDTITIHCTGGHGTARAIGSLPHFCGTTSSYGRCSSNYGIGDDGSIGLYAPENYRSWCSGGDRKVNGMSGGDNDDRAITIEVCCDPNHPYKVTDAAYDATIRLLADVCLRNGIKKLLWKNDPNLVGQVDKQNMTVHRWWANKACPGDYLMDHMGDIANQVNKLISGFPGTADKIIGNAPLKIINDQENTDPSAYQGTSNGSSSSGNGFTRGKNIGKACYMDSNYKPGAEDHAAIWKFLKSQGASDHAAAAIIGAWCGESGGRGDSVEGYYLPNYPGTENVMKTYESMDDFTKNILFPAYAGRISINKEAYKDFSGKYYLPGIGVRGFTGPLADGLITYSRNHKEDWRLIETQLHFMANDAGEHSRMQNIIAKLNGQRNMRDSVAEIMASYQGMGWDWTNANGATVDYRTQAANNVLSRFKGSGSGLVGGKSGMEASVSSNAFANNSGPSDAAKKYINTIFKKKEATLPYGGSELLQTAAMIKDPKKSITHYTGVTKAQYSKNDKDIANFINESNSVQASYSAMLNSRMANIPPAVASPSAMGSGIKKFKGTVFDDSTLNFTGGRSELATPASAVPSQQSPVYVGNNSNYTKQLTDMISYVKKIADNTTYNASTPVLIEVVTKAVELLGVIAGNSGTSNSKSMAANAESADFNQYIQDQITQMKAKMETIATTL